MPNRWVVAAAGAALVACLGTVYAWSLFAQPLAVAFGWSSTVTTWAFAANILALGVGALFGGRWQDRAGPRPVALAGVLLWAAGNVAAGLGTARLGAPWLYATYGIAGGFGIGLAYVTPVAAVARWFPDRRGLGTGIVVMGFGLGAFFHAHALRAWGPFAAAAREAAALASAGQGERLSADGTAAMLGAFVGSGVVFAVVGSLAAALLRNPTSTSTSTSTPTPTPTPTATSDLTLSAALHTRRFWVLFALLFLNVSAGILVISNAVPIVRELTGLAPTAAAALYGSVALANGVGRFLWGAVSDRTGRRRAYALLLVSQAVAFAALSRSGTAPSVATWLVVVLLAYGGGFGTMPAFVADLFGTRHLGAIYGAVLLAWSAAGLAGPLFVAAVRDATGSYAGALPAVAAVTALAAAVLPRLARRPRFHAPPSRGA